MTEEKKIETTSSMSKDTKSKISKEMKPKTPKETESATSKEVSGQSNDKVEKKIETASSMPKDTKSKISKETKSSTSKEVEKKEVAKKKLAVARGVGLRVSPKQCVYVCRIIKGKSPDVAIARLQDVIDERRAVPMAGLEVGHKKGKGMAGGRFPKNACRAVMDVVKQAGANAVVAGIDEPVIVVAKSDRAAAPFRRGGRKAKRCHIYIEVRAKEVKE